MRDDRWPRHRWLDALDAWTAVDDACHPVCAMTTARDRPPEEAPEDTSFARGLRVFLAIADRGAMRADELATLLETPLSTIYRYLRTLTEFGFVDRHEGAYRLGPRLLVGGGSTVSSEELIRRADPILIMLAAETGETAVISRRIGLAAVCLHQQPSEHPLRVMLEVGSATPLGVGALGRVLLAYAPSGDPGRGARRRCRRHADGARGDRAGGTADSGLGGHRPDRW